MRHFAHIRDAIAASLLGGTLLTAAACSGSTEAEDFSGSGADSANYADGEGGSTGGMGGDTAGPDMPGGSTGTEDDGYSDTEGADGSTGVDTGEEPLEPSPGPYAPCPADLPESWIFCEDFESATNPAFVFFDYVDSGGNFIPSFEGGASGTGAMRAHYREGEEGAGFLSVSFGNNPINTAGRPSHADEQNFDEVYWRFRVKMEPGWPDAGPHNLTRISAFAQSDWGQAMVASIASKGDDVMLEASGSSCVQDGQVVCTGVDDMESLEPLGSLIGATPVFSSQRAGVWQCVEAHVKLNTPGDPDGVFELWVDDELEGARYDVDWRGSWAEFGLNLLSIENFWTGGAPADLDRWFDDLVISTAPIGCG